MIVLNELQQSQNNSLKKSRNFLQNDDNIVKHKTFVDMPGQFTHCHEESAPSKINFI